jgi:hypothetical protein
MDWLSADLLAPAVYALIGGLDTLAWKTRGEELRDLEAGLRPERRRLYPFITMMTHRLYGPCMDPAHATSC